jgi:hypothetical protein
MQFELGVKSIAQIQPLLELIEKHQITDISLPDKPTWLPNLELARGLLAQNSKLKITLNFAVANHYTKKTDIFSTFSDFVAQANAVGIKDFLVVSGGQKKKVDSLDLLTKIGGLSDINRFYCAYNPYLDNSELELENQRLIVKLDTGVVTGVYLQIGTDIAKLKSGLDFIYSLNPTIKVLGCLLIPNPSILNSLNFRPWKGVRLDKEYVLNYNFAEQKTTEIYQIYRDCGVIPLIEIMPFQTQNLFNFYQKYASIQSKLA